MPIRKIPVTWNTGIGGVGVSFFYTAFGTDATTDLGTFFNAIKGQFPTIVSWDIPNAGDVVDETTGLITGAWTGGTPATVVGGLAGGYVAGTGCFIRWSTAGVVNGHRVRGRTFMCPMPGVNFESNGTIATATVTALQTPTSALVSTGKLQIWHRPRVTGDGTGAVFPVVSGLVADKVTSLRSRRT